MIRAFTLLAVASAMAVSAYAQPFVSAGEVEGTLVCGDLLPGSTYQQQIGIRNPLIVQSEFVIAYAIHTNAPGRVSDISVILLNGIAGYFQYGTIQTTVDWVGDTAVVGIHAASNPLFPGGLPPVTTGAIAYFGINFRTPYSPSHGSYLIVLDSASSPTYGDWSWSAFAGLPPAGSGSVLSVRESFPNCGPAFLNGPVEALQASPCAAARYDFDADGFDCGMATFEVVNAPEGATIDPQTGLFQWQPGAADAGQQFGCVVRVGDDVCGDRSYVRWTHYQEFTVTVLGCSPPEFVRNQTSKFVVSTGEELSVSMQVSDPDPVNNHTFSWYVTAQDVMPPCETNQATGQFTYTGSAADTGLYYVYEVVHDGPYADTTGFFLYHFDSYTCGDMDHSGGIVVSDLNWLVSYLFRSGPHPVAMEAGNVDCKAGIGVADLTYIVNFLFKGGPAPCFSCP